MRALAIVRRRGVQHQRLLGAVEPAEILHRWVQREEAVERQRGVRAVERQGEFAVQLDVFGIADRPDRREAVERAAQDDDDEAGIAGARRARGARQVRRGEHRAGGAEEAAAVETCGHAHLLWNSGDRINSA